MINLPDKFSEENLARENSPSVIVDLQEENVEVEETLQVDWQANTGESNVDYATQVGDVILNTKAVSNEQQTGMNSVKPLQSYIVTAWSTSQAWQSFKQERGFSVFVDTVQGIFYRANTSTGATAYCAIFDAKNGSQLTSTKSVNVTALANGDWYSFDFSAEYLELASGTTYWIKFWGILTSTPPVINILNLGINTNTSSYTRGQLDATGDAPGVNIGDASFKVSFRDNYYSSGYIVTDEMDVGLTPVHDGEWAFEDLQPDDSSLTYEAWNSPTGIFGGEETYLGNIVDGQTITDLKRYYKVKATFSANSDQNETPALQSIKASFTQFVTYSDNPDLGFEVALKSISSLSTTIDTFKASTIGQMTLTFEHSATLSEWIATKYPKNKDVIVYAGFRGEGWAKQDHIQFFHGQIDAFSLNNKNQIIITVKDFSKEWSVDIPASWEDAGDDVTWTAQHHIDVMLDILQNQINVRDSKIDLDSFATVKAALSGWEVTRTITGDPEVGKELMEELRVLISAFFIPNANGSIRIKRFDSAEEEIDSLTDDDFIGVSTWDANAGSLINRALTYLNWDGDGDSAADFSDVDISTNATSQTNHNEIATHEIKDRWTRTAEKTAQIVDGIATDILNRYADPPVTLSVTVDRKKIHYEPGDIVKVTTAQAPSSDGSGIVDTKFQIVNKNLDFLKDRIKLKLLEV